MTTNQSIYHSMHAREAAALREAISALGESLSDGDTAWLPEVYRDQYDEDVLVRLRGTLDALSSRFDGGTDALTCVAEELLAYELLCRVLSETGARAEDDCVAGLYDLFEDYDFQMVYDATRGNDIASIHHQIEGWWMPFAAPTARTTG